MSRPVHCAMQCGNTPIAMVYYWSEAIPEILRQPGASTDLSTAHAAAAVIPAPMYCSSTVRKKVQTRFYLFIYLFLCACAVCVRVSMES